MRDEKKFIFIYFYKFSVIFRNRTEYILSNIQAYQMRLIIL